MIRIEPYKDEEVNDILKKLLANTEFLSFVEKNLNNKESKFLSLPGLAEPPAESPSTI